MKKDLLLQGAALLEANAANPTGMKFDLSWWGNAMNEDGVLSVSCGTTGCAMGLFALSGAFEKHGLLDPNKDNPIEAKQTFSLLPIYVNPDTGQYRSGFNAAVELFGISSGAANYLFNSDAYGDDVPTTGADGELAVMNRIRAFVESDGQMPDDKRYMTNDDDYDADADDWHHDD